MSLSDDAYRAIRRKIVSLELAPGSTISEASLQDTLGFGRTPIREALLRLSLERLVTIVPRRGMFVTDIGIPDLRRLFEVRLVLEPMAVELAVRRGSPAHWQRMEEVIAGIPDVHAPNAYHAVIEMDETCHKIIYEAADNPFLQDMLSMLYALSLRLWYYFLAEINSMQSVVLDHQALLESLKAGDAGQAAALMGKHIQTFQRDIQVAMLGLAQLPE